MFVEFNYHTFNLFSFFIFFLPHPKDFSSMLLLIKKFYHF